MDLIVFNLFHLAADGGSPLSSLLTVLASSVHWMAFFALQMFKLGAHEYRILSTDRVICEIEFSAEIG